MARCVYWLRVMASSSRSFLRVRGSLFNLGIAIGIRELSNCPHQFLMSCSFLSWSPTPKSPSMECEIGVLYSFPYVDFTDLPLDTRSIHF